MQRFEAGDVVVIREDAKTYKSIAFPEVMAQYKGMKAVIVYSFTVLNVVVYRLDIDNRQWMWCDCWLDPYTDVPEVTFDSFIDALV